MTQYCHITDNQIDQGPCALPKNWRNVSGLNMLNDSQLKLHNWLPVIQSTPPTYNTTSQKLSTDYDIGEDQVTKTYTIIDKSQSEIDADLAAAKESKISEIAADRYEIETGGVTYGDYVILSDRDSISRLKETIDEIAAGTVQSINWKCANNQWLVIDADNAIAIKMAMLSHIMTCFNAEKAAQEAVNAMTDIDTINNYTFAIG